MTTRQKLTAAVFVIILLIVVWQLYGLFSSDTSAPIVPKTTTAGTPGAPLKTGMQTPQPAQLSARTETLSPREMELIKLQQETQAKYVSALNELQMLKITRDIAETNQAIATAKLATITAEKGVVDLLTVKPTPPPPPTTYAPPGVNQVGQPTKPLPVEEAETDVAYSVISVSLLQFKWNAVLGYQGNLYSVAVGDVLPPDRSKVVAISKSGVVLERKGVRRRLSLVPII